MAKLNDEAGSEAATWPDTSPLEIKVEPDDALFGPGPLKSSGKASRGSSFFGRLLLTLVLCGLAWAAGAYYSSGRLPFDLSKWGLPSQAQQNTERDEMLATMRQMADEIRALKSSIETNDAARAAAADTQNNEKPAASGATIADLAGRIDKLQGELTTKLAQVSEQLAALQQQIAASHSAPHVASASHAPAAHPKHEHPHDAFDPAQHPNAVGAPQPLGIH